jgi:hypothetical protein
LRCALAGIVAAQMHVTVNAVLLKNEEFFVFIGEKVEK